MVIKAVRKGSRALWWSSPRGVHYYMAARRIQYRAIRRDSKKQSSFFMGGSFDVMESVISSWRVNSRVTSFLFENLSEEVMALKIPGAPRRTVRMIGGHVHNCRCMWIKMIGRRYGLPTPEQVDRFKILLPDLLSALDISGGAITTLLETGFQHAGRLSGFPLDVVHFSSYLIAHEGHHRGQIIMVARQQGHRLPKSVSTGIWQWSKRRREMTE